MLFIIEDSEFTDTCSKEETTEHLKLDKILFFESNCEVQDQFLSS